MPKYTCLIQNSGELLFSQRLIAEDKTKRNRWSLDCDSVRLHRAEIVCVWASAHEAVCLNVHPVSDSLTIIFFSYPCRVQHLLAVSE